MEAGGGHKKVWVHRCTPGVSLGACGHARGRGGADGGERRCQGKAGKGWVGPVQGAHLPLPPELCLRCPLPLVLAASALPRVVHHLEALELARELRDRLALEAGIAAAARTPLPLVSSLLPVPRAPLTSQSPEPLTSHLPEPP